MSNNYHPHRDLIEDVAELTSNLLLSAQGYRDKRGYATGGYIAKALPVALSTIDDLDRVIQWQTPRFSIALEEAKHVLLGGASGLLGIWLEDGDEVPCLHYPERHQMILYAQSKDGNIPMSGFCSWNKEAGVYEFLIRTPQKTAFVGNSNQSKTKLFAYCLDDSSESVLYTFTRK